MFGETLWWKSSSKWYRHLHQQWTGIHPLGKNWLWAFYMGIWYCSRQGRFKQGLWSRNVCQLESTLEDYFDRIWSQELWLHKMVVEHNGLQNYIVWLWILAEALWPWKYNFIVFYSITLFYSIYSTVKYFWNRIFCCSFIIKIVQFYRW